jgi:hypothetical protein
LEMCEVRVKSYVSFSGNGKDEAGQVNGDQIMP